LASAYRALSPFGPVTWGDNYRSNTDTQSPNLAQQEPSIGVNPTNPLNVVVAAKDEREGVNTKHVWIYTSTDGGVTWINQRFPYRLPAPGFSSDPVVNFADDGVCYITSLPYGSGTIGIQTARSNDGCLTFVSTGQVTTNSGSDKEWTYIDNYPSSPFYHRMYVAWRNFSTSADIMINYSTDRGATWSPDTPVTATAYQFPMPVVLPNGDVIVTYLQSFGSLNYSRSTDGGVTFGLSQFISTITQPNCPPDNSGCGIWRLNPIPATGVNPTDGSMVIVWADGQEGQSIIRYTRSTDSGATWSTAAVLAPPGVADVYQVEPWVEADENGLFHAIWYDNRENPNTSIFHIYYSQSSDNGATWTPAVRISTATSDLRIGIPSSYARAAGDYIQVAASHGNVYAAWTDTRSGTGEDIYVVRGTYGGGSPTSTPTGPTATRTPTRTYTPTRTSTPTATPTACVGYTYSSSTCPIVPGTVDIGNHCDACMTNIALPFTFALYGQSFNGANVASDGTLQFITAYLNPSTYCLPANMGPTILAHWDDLLTNCTGCGVFTSISGSAPNRIFNIEWRAALAVGGQSVNFEVRLYETLNNFSIVFGQIGGSGSGATVGVQNAVGAFTQFSCNTAIPDGTCLTFTLGGCTTPTNTPTRTVTASTTVTPPPCTMNFSDVQPSDWFHEYVYCLYCLHGGGVISGYADGTFRPYNNVTRGQISKIAILAFEYPINTQGGPHFSDVPITSPFYQYIETAAHNGIITGYADGTFRPQNNVTRGQTAKIVVLAAQWPLVSPSIPTFIDVPTDHPFFVYIETAFCRHVISGYSDGTFRPENNVTRGQVAKILCLASRSPAPCALPTVTPSIASR
jgi:hypothetical protein